MVGNSKLSKFKHIENNDNQYHKTEIYCSFLAVYLSVYVLKCLSIQGKYFIEIWYSCVNYYNSSRLRSQVLYH